VKQVQMTGQGTQRGPPWCADRSAPDSRPLPRPAQGPRRAILQERRPTSGQKSAQAASFSRIRLGRSAPHRPRDRGEGLALHTKRDQSRRFPRQRSPRISIEIGRQSLHHTFLRVEMFLLRCAANPLHTPAVREASQRLRPAVGRGLQRQTKNGVSDHRRPEREQGAGTSATMTTTMRTAATIVTTTSIIAERCDGSSRRRSRT